MRGQPPSSDTWLGTRFIVVVGRLLMHAQLILVALPLTHGKWSKARVLARIINSIVMEGSDNHGGLLPSEGANCRGLPGLQEEVAPSEKNGQNGLAFLDETDEGTDDGSRVKCSRTSYPRPPCSASTWVAMLQDEALYSPTSRAAKLLGSFLSSFLAAAGMVQTQTDR